MAIKSYAVEEKKLDEWFKLAGFNAWAAHARPVMRWLT
jgi:hypothetical protein